MSKPKVLLNLYWHMHQPDYRDVVTNEYVLPWTYLHAIKDYTDMVFHLESNPKARVTFNFVPILLDQLEDYALQFSENKIRDPLLAMLGQESLDYISPAQCELIIDSCFKSHHEKMLAPYPQYQRLYELHQIANQSSSDDINLQYFSGQYKADLLVWYHLAWMGESVKRNNMLVQVLMKKGCHFSYAERRALFDTIGELITNLIPRYKALATKKQIEISSTPHYHPILPLLLDFKSTRDAMPNAPLPQTKQYSGGRLRARTHVEMAQISHTKRFDELPKGMWPAEGAVSHAALTMLAEHGVQWAATGQGVLANSLTKMGVDVTFKPNYLYQLYQVTDGNHDILCFFRDDQLSDKIGFEYAKMHSTDAVADFLQSLQYIYHENNTDQHRVVSVILDGENAWEYFPYNGYYFLTELYQALTQHPHIEMTTFSDVVGKMHVDATIPVATLKEIVAGSWVYGSFSTWIGSADKNLGWDLLCDAKAAYDKVLQSNHLSKERLSACEEQLAICEGSDWFWWLGDYNSAMSVDSFDSLFRRNLANLYRLLELNVPEILNKPISVGSGDPAMGGAMRRGSE